MDFFFSGIAGPAEVALLQAAGAQHVLVDPHQAPHIAAWAGVTRAKDSGEFARWRNGTPLPPWDTYIADAVQYRWLVAPDVIGDPEATALIWARVRGSIPNLAPVWHWGGEELVGPARHRQFLEGYLHDAPPVVCIGALVPHLRSRREERLSPEQRKAWNTQRKATTARLVELGRTYPGRFHALGLCYVHAVVELHELLASADSSLWLSPARHGDAIFIHTRSHKLSQAPAGVLPEARGWSREQRCIEAVRAIQGYTMRTPPLRMAA